MRGARSFISRKGNPSVIGASAPILLGGVIALSLGILVTPILTRLVRPEDFGVYGIIVASGTVLGAVATARLELLAQGEQSSAYSRSLFDASVKQAVLFSLIVAGVTSVSVLKFDVSWHWLFVGPVSLAVSLQLVGMASAAFSQDYKRIGKRNVLQAVLLTGAQVAGAAMGWGTAALALGYCAGRVVWVREARPVGRLREVWRAHGKFMRRAMPSVLLNAGSGQIPLLGVGLLFGPAAAGLYVMSDRLVFGPLSVLAQAISSGVIGKIGQDMRGGVRVSGALIRMIGQLLCLGGLGLLFVIGVCFFWIEQLLGPGWSEVPMVMLAGAGAALSRFVASPVVGLLSVAGRGDLLLRWEIFRAVILVLPFIAGSALGMGLVAIIALYSGVTVIVYVVVVIMVHRVVAGYDSLLST